ncbi:alpha/beta hydrolase [Paracoccus sp. (in: a-proteobacteria)]|uniref:alpha/beta hydrolase n=1 Tax=Paracoccus sp. TaxID=267 RepID=UPI0026DEB0BE|nr:alpha/beta hydrolase [Paracoccus sp. (in: a-proteobacteria)]MDO5369983.1 alpha/beta hydrolase [Paracoccus sp. (in: a-proteobacteria)]
MDAVTRPPPGPQGFQPAPLNRLSGEPPSPGQAFFLQAEDGLRLRLGLWQPRNAATGTVLLFPGRIEYLEKYDGIASRLAAADFAVLAIDWRGQGLSDRLLRDPRAGHIADFADYQNDVVEMVVAAQALGLPRPWHLLAHSMGGCIGLAALLNGLPVETAAFSAPMWGLRHPRVPDAVITGLTGTARRLGRAELTAIGTGGGGTYLLDAPFRGNALTGDPVQWARLVAQAGSWPDLTLGGATYAWIAAARAECRRLAALPSPDLPALIALGGAEAVVSATAVRARAAAWPQGQLLDLPGARHELMFEAAPVAERFLSAAVDLFRG